MHTRAHAHIHTYTHIQIHANTPQAHKQGRFTQSRCKCSSSVKTQTLNSRVLRLQKHPETTHMCAQRQTQHESYVLCRPIYIAIHKNEFRQGCCNSDFAEFRAVFNQISPKTHKYNFFVGWWSGLNCVACSSGVCTPIPISISVTLDANL